MCVCSSNSGFATPYVYGSYGECVARIDSLAAGLEKGGEKLLDKNDDGMLLVRWKRYYSSIICKYMDLKKKILVLFIL